MRAPYVTGTPPRMPFHNCLPASYVAEVDDVHHVASQNWMLPCQHDLSTSRQLNDSFMLMVAGLDLQLI